MYLAPSPNAWGLLRERGGVATCSGLCYLQRWAEEFRGSGLGFFMLGSSVMERG